jgi:hypothetical protein
MSVYKLDPPLTFIKLANSKQLWTQRPIDKKMLKYILDNLYDTDIGVELNVIVIDIKHIFDGGRRIGYYWMIVSKNTLEEIYKSPQVRDLYGYFSNDITWRYHVKSIIEFVKNFKVNIKLMPEELKRWMIEYS